jgi:hypothetical protein
MEKSSGLMVKRCMASQAAPCWRSVHVAIGSTAMSGQGPTYPLRRLNNHTDNTTIASAGIRYAMR